MSKIVKWHSGIYIRGSVEEGRNNDAWLITEIVNHDEYKLNSIKFTNLKYVIDIGASIGVFSIAIHNKYPDAKITCIDPNPNTLEVLKLNVGNFAKVLYGAISYDKNIYLKNGKRDFEMSVTTEKIGKKVKVINLGNLIKNGCDLLKIDCEGVEYDIFAYEDLSKVRYIIGEWHNTIKWKRMIKQYLELYPHWNYVTLVDHGDNGNFFMKNNQNA